ncbi:MAG: hypothetical protein DWQ37_14060 [Planctomycetota bacterium]|nr:MAG: hypothetical protein DWQ37_14060 [Planctomycetota bacterium]
MNQEHLALAKQQHEELQQFRQTTLAAQRSAIRMQRIAFGVLVVVLLLLVVIVMLAPRLRRSAPPAQPLPQEFDEPVELTRASRESLRVPAV